MGVLKIRRITQDYSTNNPELINYDFLTLNKKKTYLPQGPLSSVEYYLNYDLNTNIYNDLIVKEEYNYLREPTSLVWLNRTTIVSWYDEDENILLQKSFTKNFAPHEIIEFGEDRRKMLINNCKAYIYSQSGLNEVDAFTLLTLLESEIDTYIKGYMLPLIQKVGDTVNFIPPFLTSLIRTNILAIINQP